MIRTAALGFVVAISLPSSALAQYALSADYYAQQRSYTAPSSGMEITVTAGESIAETRVDRLIEGVKLLDDALAAKGTLGADQGTRLYRIATSKAYKACAVTSTECLIDDDGDNTFDRIASDDVAGAKPLVAKVRYERVSEGVVLPAASAGLSRTILYQGAASGVLKLSYREFSDSIARDAFSEDISIQVSESFPQRFAVKGLSFTILSISPLGMTFTLDKIAPEKGWPDQLK